MALKLAVARGSHGSRHFRASDGFGMVVWDRRALSAFPGPDRIGFVCGNRFLHGHDLCLAEIGPGVGDPAHAALLPAFFAWQRDGGCDLLRLPGSRLRVRSGNSQRAVARCSLDGKMVLASQYAPDAPSFPAGNG